MWRISALALFFVAAHSPSSKGDELFSIAKPQFSARVLDDGNYTAVNPATDNKISRAVLSEGLVYFSFTVLGDEKTIQSLKDRGRLDVFAVIYAGGVRRDTVQIGIDQQKWAQTKQRILGKFDEDGFFTFRTFMNTKQIQNSVVEILVRDGRSNVISRKTIEIVP